MRVANLVALLALILAAETCLAETTMKPIKTEAFGKTTDGKEVTLYSLENAKGMKARVMTYGANLVSLEVPDKAGKIGDVTLGFDTLDGYLKPNPFFGATAGRYANRIAKGEFSLNRRKFKLAKNNGENHLHGGLKGFDKVVWAGEVVEGVPNSSSVRFSYTSPDGEEGYPGNLKTTVMYTLTDNNELVIDYTATTDKLTVLNLTNHTYWNLAGAAAGNILDHELTLNAKNYVAVGNDGIPTDGVVPVKGTVMDFTEPHLIGERIKDVGNTPVGYDHTWVLNPAPELNKCAVVYDKKSGRVMEVETTEPGVQFYTGNFLDGSVTARGGVVCNKHQGFCLETQHYPASPNHPEFPTTMLKPDATYRQKTVHRFSVK